MVAFFVAMASVAFGYWKDGLKDGVMQAKIELKADVCVWPKERGKEERKRKRHTHTHTHTHTERERVRERERERERKKERKRECVWDRESK